MRAKIVFSVFKKEVIDILRDKKTLFMMIILPILLYPVMMIGGSQLMMMSMDEMKSEKVNISFSQEINKNLENLLEKTTKDDDISLNIVQTKDYKKDLQDRKIEAYIEPIKQKDDISYKVYINSASNTSSMVEDRIKDSLNEYKDVLVKESLKKEGLDVEKTLEPISYKFIDTAKNEEIAGHFLGQILPLILITGVLLGAIYPAIDIIAGEKERGTLETLLTLPITNLELIMGKYLSVSFSAIMTAIFNIASIFLTIGYMVYSQGMASQMGLDKFDFSKLIFPLIITIICICLFAMVVSAISMCVCSFAKSFKDAQNYITPLMLVILLPSYVSMIPTMQLNSINATIPIINISLLIKSVLSFNSNMGLIAMVLVSNIAFVILSVILLSKLFNSEEVLFGSGGNFSLLEKRENIKNGTMPSTGDAVTLYAIGLIFIIYIANTIQIKFGMNGLAMTQAGILLLPLLFAYYIKTNFKKVFKLNPLKLKDIVGGLLLWLGGYIISMLVIQLLMKLLPNSEEVVKGIGNALFKKDSFIINLAIVALLPAICEEMFFRGFVYSGLTNSKTSPNIAILISAVLFGFMHMDFIRIIPTTILGIVLAYSVYKSGSIFIAMLIHFVNNALSVSVSHFPNSFGRLEKLLSIESFKSDIPKIIGLLLASIVLLYIGSKIINIKNNKNKKQEA